MKMDYLTNVNQRQPFLTYKKTKSRAMGNPSQPINNDPKGLQSLKYM